MQSQSKYPQHSSQKQKKKKFLSKKDDAGRITSPDPKPYYRAVIIKSIRYWHKKRHVEMGQNTRHKHEYIKLQKYSICQRFQKHTLEERASSAHGADKTQYPHGEE